MSRLAIQAELEAELARRTLERRQAGRHPAHLLKHATMPDTRLSAGWGSQEERVGEFRFNMDQPDEPWYWQRDYLDWMIDHPRTITLKARQLGATWVAAGLALWTALYRPGTEILIYRQKEKDAGEIVNRIWDMYRSLPEHLRNDSEVISPTRGARPSTEIELQFPNGKLSTILGMASTAAAGHGRVVGLIIMDEFARIDAADELMSAVQPAAGSKGKIIIISTANGRSNPETGEGNHFHYLWESPDAGFEKRFLSWRMHPDRDQKWYDTDPEIRGLRPWKRAEQFPDNPHEAFTLTNKIYFDEESLLWYAENAIGKPLYRFDFIRSGPRTAKRRLNAKGTISVYAEPDPEGSYAIGADVATGRHADYSAAYVVDLGSMALVAELHGRIDADVYALHLHYLGRWYNTAVIAIETGGGYGEAPIIFLKDGKDGRPPYPKLYRHTIQDRGDLPMMKPYGYPMNLKTRPLILGYMERVLREKHLPFLTDRLLEECMNFVTHETGTSPRAQIGLNDDCVMACAITLEMYRLRGHHPDRPRRKAKKPSRLYPWQEELEYAAA